jgi:hypothetical protein
MSDVKIFRFTQSIHHYKQGDIYVTHENTMNAIKEAFRKKMLIGMIEEADYLDIPQYHSGDKASWLIFMRDGALGDLFAMSSPIAHIGLPVKYITTPANAGALPWLQHKQIEVCDARQPIFRKTLLPLKKFLQTIRRAHTTTEVEDGSPRNWYEVWFEKLGREVDPTWYRPAMTPARVSSAPSIIDPAKPSIMICHKASSPNRTMAFSTLYNAINEILGKDADVNLYTHYKGLSSEDIAQIVKDDDERLHIIPSRSVGEYLLDLYDATLVISVDTAAIHFREGVEKPAIGIYSSFTTESRVKYYKHIMAFDIKSSCQYQPCFKHGPALTPDVCAFGTTSLNVAPCLSRLATVSIRRQLVEGMKDYVLKHIGK